MMQDEQKKYFTTTPETAHFCEINARLSSNRGGFVYVRHETKLCIIKVNVDFDI